MTSNQVTKFTIPLQILVGWDSKEAIEGENSRWKQASNSRPLSHMMVERFFLLANL